LLDDLAAGNAEGAPGKDAARLLPCHLLKKSAS